MLLHVAKSVFNLIYKLPSQNLGNWKRSVRIQSRRATQL